VVRGRDHHHGRTRGVGDGEQPGRPPLGAPVDHPGAPDRPADVQRRHRGQLVGQAAEALGGAGVAAPPALVGGGREGVDVAGQHPGRRHRQQREADQADRRRDDQGIAHLSVATGPPVVDPHQDGRRDDVVQQGVPVARGQCQPRRRGRDGVRPPLDVEPQGCLDPEQLARVGGRGRDVWVADQTGAAVRDVQQGQQRQLTHGCGSCISHGCSSVGHRSILLRGTDNGHR
jgi:hypothetical protein